MSKVFIEGELEITFPSSVSVRKFDEDYGLSSASVKAVDFVVEEPERLLFIEFKDPENRQARPENRQAFVRKFQSGELNRDLMYKCRDTFLYGYCAGWVNSKPSYYYVLLTLEGVATPILSHKIDELKRTLLWQQPMAEPSWSPFLKGCAVFNIASWNRVFRDYPVRRLP